MSAMIRYVGVRGLVLVLSLMTTATAAGDAALTAYREAWLERERQAKRDADREQLAKDLLAAARKTQDDTALAVLLCRRAYHFGRQQRASYQVAAHALERMVAFDPSTRGDSLSMVRDLYHAAYKASPSINLGMGVRSAEASALVAREARRALDEQIRAGQIEPSRALVESNKIVREWQNAYRTVSAAVNSAKSHERRLAARPKGAGQLELIRTFLKEHQPAVARYREQVRRAGAYKKQIARLNTLSQEADESDDAKAELGWLYLSVHGSPAGAQPYAAAFLEPEQRTTLQMAAEAGDALTGTQCLELAGWFAALAEDAPEAAGKQGMVRQAAGYLLLCDQAFEEDDPRFAQTQALAKTIKAKAEAAELALADIEVHPKSGWKATLARSDTDEAPPTQGAGAYVPADWTQDTEDAPASDAGAADAQAAASPPTASEKAPPKEPASDDKPAQRQAAGGGKKLPSLWEEEDDYWSDKQSSIFDFGQ